MFETEGRQRGEQSHQSRMSSEQRARKPDSEVPVEWAESRWSDRAGAGALEIEEFEMTGSTDGQGSQGWWSVPKSRFRKTWQPWVKCGYLARELSADWGQLADLYDAVEQGDMDPYWEGAEACGHDDCWSLACERGEGPCRH